MFICSYIYMSVYVCIHICMQRWSAQPWRISSPDTQDKFVKGGAVTGDPGLTYHVPLKNAGVNVYAQLTEILLKNRLSLLHDDLWCFINSEWPSTRYENPPSSPLFRFPLSLTVCLLATRRIRKQRNIHMMCSCSAPSTGECEHPFDNEAKPLRLTKFTCFRSLDRVLYTVYEHMFLYSFYT